MFRNTEPAAADLSWAVCTDPATSLLESYPCLITVPMYPTGSQFHQHPAGSVVPDLF